MFIQKRTKKNTAAENRNSITSCEAQSFFFPLNIYQTLSFKDSKSKCINDLGWNTILQHQLATESGQIEIYFQEGVGHSVKRL